MGSKTRRAAFGPLDGRLSFLDHVKSLARSLAHGRVETARGISGVQDPGKSQNAKNGAIAPRENKSGRPCMGSIRALAVLGSTRQPVCDSPARAFFPENTSIQESQPQRRQDLLGPLGRETSPKDLPEARRYGTMGPALLIRDGLAVPGRAGGS